MMPHNSQPMVFPKEFIAHQIAQKMKDANSVDYAVVKIPTGYQVAAVKKLPSGMPPAKPAPVLHSAPAPKASKMAQKAKNPIQALQKAAEGFEVAKPTSLPITQALQTMKPVSTGKGSVVVALKYRGESKVFVDAFREDGSPVSFGKTTLIAFQKIEDKWVIEVTNAVAKKRGLI